MICVPDELEQIDGIGWLVHWPCAESEIVVGDPVDAIRTHLCPDPDGLDIGREASSSPRRLLPSGAQDRSKAAAGYPPCSEALEVSDESGGQVKEGLTDSLIPAAIDRGCNPGAMRAADALDWNGTR